MGMYREEWACCNSATETEAWIPEECPFCQVERLEKELKVIRNQESQNSQETEETDEEKIAKMDEYLTDVFGLDLTYSQHEDLLGKIREIFLSE